MYVADRVKYVLPHLQKSILCKSFYTDKDIDDNNKTFKIQLRTIKAKERTKNNK